MKKNGNIIEKLLKYVRYFTLCSPDLPKDFCMYCTSATEIILELSGEAEPNIK